MFRAIRINIEVHLFIIRLYSDFWNPGPETFCTILYYFWFSFKEDLLRRIYCIIGLNWDFRNEIRDENMTILIGLSFPLSSKFQWKHFLFAALKFFSSFLREELKKSREYNEFGTISTIAWNIMI